MTSPRPTRASTTTAPTATDELAEVDLPGFAPPPRRPDDPLSGSSTINPNPNPTRRPNPAEMAEGIDDWPADGGLGEQLERDLLSRIPNVTPSQVSTADPKAFEGLAELFLGVTGIALNARLAPERDYGENMLWLPDADDVDAIAGPVSRLIARRVKVTDREAGDITDSIELAVGVGGFAMKNAMAQRARRQELHQRAQNAGAGQQREQDQ